MPMNKYGDMEMSKESGGGMEGMGKLSRSMDATQDDREMAQFRTRKESYLRKLMKMYRIDRDMADQLMDKMGGLSSVVKKFQMVDDDERKTTYDEIEDILTNMGGRKAAMKKIEEME